MSPSKKLLRWFDTHCRDLPWRKTQDSYHITVSEIMLQQTQALHVRIYFEKWLQTFPSWKSLAGATNGQVLRAWSGLGYNRRSILLRNIAKFVTKHGQPHTEQGWRAMKGIGVYTAAAITLFAQHKLTFPIDTTIRRIGDRYFLGILFPHPEQDYILRKLGLDFLKKNKRFYDLPQALFDLAAAICTKSPACGHCPLRASCLSAEAFLKKRVAIPKAMIQKSLETKHRHKPYPNRIYRGRILKLVQTTPNGIPIATIGLLIDPTFAPKHDHVWLSSILEKMEQEQLIKRTRHAVVLVT